MLLIRLISRLLEHVSHFDNFVNNLSGWVWYEKKFKWLLDRLGASFTKINKTSMNHLSKQTDNWVLMKQQKRISFKGYKKCKLVLWRQGKKMKEDVLDVDFGCTC